MLSARGVSPLPKTAPPGIDRDLAETHRVSIPPAVGTLAIGAPNWLGDAVMAEPFLRALQNDARFEVVLLCKPQVEEVCQTFRNHLPAIEVATHHSMPKRLRSRLAPRRTLWINLAMTPDFPLLARRCGARWIWGSPREDTAHLLDASLGAEFERRDTHRIDNYLSVLARLGIARPQEAQTPCLIVPDAPARSPDARSVVINTSSSNQPSKRYPAVRFVELIDLLLEEFPDVTIRLTGLAADAERNSSIATETRHPGRCIDGSGRTSLRQLIDSLAAAHLVISNDTGPMHIAAALDVATVGIFGPTSPIWTAPLGPRAHHVRTVAECAPCFASPCPLPRQICMDDISPREIVRLVRTHRLL